MPNRPKKIKRGWKPERIKHQRSVDMSWYYNDPRWRKFSLGFKERYPLCKKCYEIGLISPTAYTDHIERLRDGGAPDLDHLVDEDFQGLCDSCHASKSGKEAHGYKEVKGSKDSK
ncbi:HNH endonuclease signature motif containing protein [Aquimarina sp. Aq78]|uniref:HNH endonuclease signature motif containing protein n=1 Tax=Aquimarina sp. Aq78 TaxID=1191889 RepID=UPI000D10429D|nr:HNH endonuclease signature motif containing protein [Aquimarina sp. Aq78]